MPNEVMELRAAERYVVPEPLIGSFGVASVTILDISDHGVQVAHAQPLRIATMGRLWFKRDDLTVSAQGIVIWSHLSQTRNEKGKLLYNSGIRVDDAASWFAGVVEALATRGIIKPDRGSLDRKRQRLTQKQRSRGGRTTPLKTGGAVPEISPEQEKLIVHARDRMKVDRDEAARWYTRARRAIENGAAGDDNAIHLRQDVLAVWAYLDHAIDLAAIVEVFEREE